MRGQIPLQIDIKSLSRNIARTSLFLREWAKMTTEVTFSLFPRNYYQHQMLLCCTLARARAIPFFYCRAFLTACIKWRTILFNFRGKQLFILPFLFFRFPYLLGDFMRRLTIPLALLSRFSTAVSFLLLTALFSSLRLICFAFFEIEFVTFFALCVFVCVKPIND